MSPSPTAQAVTAYARRIQRQRDQLWSDYTHLAMDPEFQNKVGNILGEGALTSFRLREVKAPSFQAYQSKARALLEQHAKLADGRPSEFGGKWTKEKFIEFGVHRYYGDDDPRIHPQGQDAAALAYANKLLYRIDRIKTLEGEAQSRGILRQVRLQLGDKPQIIR